ncbi:SDR family NAD(P)-dependent oxidoreductase [Ralstonia solanacearum]|uniref:SDR family NAD(P)-dependent oxidoreductase n=1 Tax=Ralstonia solanacearum TaxID=305 RepID=UPI0001D9696C|nr:SDR family oxidoreductase [Ralstonia solanacearum]CBJ35903.1 putative oxidoreductase, short chain dehydrogenase/reductase family [Ralstonia solanacearum PSI07]
MTIAESKVRTVLVTGASTGIGFELARCFAKDGYNVVLVARSAERTPLAAERLANEFSVSATYIISDLGQPNAARSLVEELGRRQLDIDVLVNNAGFGEAGAFSSASAVSQLGMIDLNVRSLTELALLLVPRMMEKGQGGILNVASMAAFQPNPFMAVYGASKAYVLALSEALWEEARGTGVHISCLCPGATASQFHKRAGTDRLPAARVRMMTAEQVAKSGFRAFQENKRVEVPGISNKITSRIPQFMPRVLLLRGLRRFFEP